MTSRSSSSGPSRSLPPPHPELGGDHELVEAAFRVVEVEEADGAGVPAPGPVHGQGHTVGQVLVDRLVAGHAGGVDVLQLEDDPVGLGLGEPLIETQQGGPQPLLEQDLPLAAPFRRQRFPGHVSPPQPFQQLTGRVLGVVEFVELGGGGHSIFSNIAVQSSSRRARKRPMPGTSTPSEYP